MEVLLKITYMYGGIHILPILRVGHPNSANPWRGAGADLTLKLFFESTIFVTLNYRDNWPGHCLILTGTLSHIAQSVLKRRVRDEGYLGMVGVVGWYW